MAETSAQRLDRIQAASRSPDRAVMADAVAELISWQNDVIIRLGAALGMDLRPAPPPPPEPKPYLRLVE